MKRRQRRRRVLLQTVDDTSEITVANLRLKKLGMELSDWEQKHVSKHCSCFLQKKAT